MFKWLKPQCSNFRIITSVIKGVPILGCLQHMMYIFRWQLSKRSLQAFDCSQSGCVQDHCLPCNFGLPNICRPNLKIISHVCMAYFISKVKNQYSLCRASLNRVLCSEKQTAAARVPLMKLARFSPCITSLSRLMTKPTKWHVCPAKTQISLGIRPVLSESSLSA